MGFFEEVFTATDPVCKMPVSEDKAPEKLEYKGKTYYFCAKGCKDRFEKDPFQRRRSRLD
ncbi:MAG TPA: YHS domain-containing protein [Thermodesulfobacteriota bacterium]|nr:YHS domain-containing protein [Thermodesulfobacteriota bacterium]